MDYFRIIHNDYKKRLIKQNCYLKNVLDFGSGKAGDIHKYRDSFVNWVTLVEPNPDYVKEARHRIALSNMDQFCKIHNASAEDFRDNFKYDVVSMFFVLSFFFDKEEHLDKLIKNVSYHLKNNGKFIGTTITAEKLVPLIQNNDIDNEFFSIKKESDLTHSYGDKITFNLKGSQTAQTQTEYLVYFDLLEKICNKYSLVLTYKKCYESNSKLTDELNLLTSFYCEFIFQKK